MKYRLIASDLDGTLVDDLSRLSERTIQTLLKAQKEGILLVLCTGRSFAEACMYNQVLQLERYGGYVVYGTGNGIYHPQSGWHLHQNHLEKEEVNNLFALLKPFGLILKVETDAGFSVYMKPWVRFLLKVYCFVFPKSPRKAMLAMRCYDTTDTDPVNKISVSTFSVCKKGMYERIRKAVGDNYSVSSGTVKNVEVASKDTNKWFGLLKVLEKENISPEEVLAFGDADNDCLMVEKAGLGVAMANGSEAVKRVAKKTALGNNDDGVALFVEKLLRE